MLGPFKALGHDMAVVRRWSDEELAQCLHTLESIPPQHWSVQNHYDALEYVIQRYFPRNEPLLQKDWDTSMARMRAQVDANLQSISQGSQTTPRHLDLNQLIEKSRELLSNSYAMSQEDFVRVVVPALRRYPFAGGIELSVEVTRNLWLASATVGQRTTHEDRYATSDARDMLVGLLSQALIDAAATLRRTYETLRRASNAGCESVALVAPASCRCVHDLLDGRAVAISRLLAAFEAGEPEIPPARTPCTVSEDPQVCRLEVRPIELPLAEPGDDLDFAACLQDILSTQRPKLDPGWEVMLQERVRRSLAGA